MKLLTLDGNSIINRAYYGIRPLSTKEGVPTNAIYGFMNILNSLIERTQPDVIAAAFDLKAPTFRHKMYADYKAGRKAMPDDLREQIPLMKELLADFGCIVLEKEGYEADDILGTLSRICDEQGNECVIATGDRDSFQLVTDNVHVLLAATKMGRPEITEYTPALIMEKYGVTPPEMIEIKALQGDSSDNIPGVAGIGEKTAGTLIQKYHSIDYIYDNMASLDEKDSVKNKLLAGKDSAYMSRELGTICKTVPLTLPADADYLHNRDNDRLKAMLIRLEMFKLLERYGFDNQAPEQITLQPQKSDIHFTSADKLPDNAVIYFDEQSATLFAKCGDEYYIVDKAYDAVKSANNIIVHDEKSLCHALKLDFEPSVAFDTMLAAYLASPDQSDYSLSRYALQYGVTRPDCDDADAAFNLLVTEQMYKTLGNEIEQNGQSELLHDIEIPLCYTLYRMECAGFAVDKQGIIDFGNSLDERIEQLREKVCELVGYEFNLNSPKQLGVALFEKLGLPCKKKTKTGYSTSAEVLEDLRGISDAVDFLLEYRSLAKLKSTYCDSMVKQIGDDGRIHSTLKQTETRTGRISSAEPNLQNIPVRTPQGREMRKFFISSPGKSLVDADYSQIELRVLASVANDTAMIDAFKSGVDIHTVTASQVFNIPVEAMTPDIRSMAKAVNFGIVYGIGPFSLSKDIHVSVAQAKQYIADYLNTYHGVRDYLEKTVEDAKQNGYVSTVFGRRRYLPDLHSKNANLRAFSERVAKNMPIQGTAADIIKLAMINTDRRLQLEGLPAQLIMQVHDELIIECDDSAVDQVKTVLKDEMENAVNFAVKFTTDIHSGKSWFEAK